MAASEGEAVLVGDVVDAGTIFVSPQRLLDCCDGGPAAALLRLQRRWASRDHPYNLSEDVDAPVGPGALVAARVGPPTEFLPRGASHSRPPQIQPFSWYRARVERIADFGGRREATVFLVDYGYSVDKIRLPEDVRELDDRHREIPGLAEEFVLYGND